MRPVCRLLSVLLCFAFAPSADADDFTIVVFGDTQTYSDTATFEPVFENMIDYVIANAVSDNIALVLQVGDAIEEGRGDVVTAGTTEEWARFNAQWQRLDSVVPYAVTRGNHDNTQEFSLHYGSSALSGFSHYQETHPGEDDDAHAWRADLGGEDALVLGISCNPSAAELSWAQGVLDSDPDLPAIVLSHIISNSAGFHTISASGLGEPTCNGNPPVSVWDELVAPNADQVFMTASGHFIHPSHGFKGMRETEGSIVLDTFQNWQGGASADGCMTLVRFRPAVREVEVEAWCTEANGGAGAFLVNGPGATSLPTVTVDGCLGFSLLDAFGPGVCPPPPVPIPPSIPGSPTISFNDDAVVPNSLPFRSITVSAGSLLNLASSEVLDASEIAGALLVGSDEVFQDLSGRIDRLSLDGTVYDAGVLDVDPTPFDPIGDWKGFATDGNFFYFLNTEGVAPSAGRIDRLSLDGTVYEAGVLDVDPSVFGDIGDWRGFATDGSFFYFLNTVDESPFAGRIDRLSLDGTVYEPDFLDVDPSVFGEISNWQGFATDGTFFYFLDKEPGQPSAGRIDRLSLDGTVYKAGVLDVDPSVFRSVSAFRGFATEGSSFYFLNTEGGGGVDDIDAAHFRSDDQVIFSTIGTATVDGAIFTEGDLILYDPVTGSATLFFDESSFFAGSPQNIDAFYLFEEGEHAGKLLLSTSVNAKLGGLVFKPGDLVLYDPVLDTSTRFFSQSLITGSAPQKNVDAVHVLPNGNLLLSVLNDGGSLGGLVLQDEDIVEYDPVADVATVFIPGAGLFNGTTADLNALTFAPRVPVLAPSLSPGGWALLVLALALPSLLMLSRGGRRA